MKVKITANKKKEGLQFKEVEAYDFFEQAPKEGLFPLLELMLKELKDDQSNPEQMRSERV